MNQHLASDSKQQDASLSQTQEAKTDDRLKDLLVSLISSSGILDARVWLDGIYTEIDDEQVRGSWMNNRDVYFKVEGRVDKRSNLG